MVRVGRILLIALLVTIFVAPIASAGTDTKSRFSKTLAELWTTILGQSVPESPFGNGDPCVQLADQGASRTVVPFAPIGTAELTCNVPLGTKIFISAFSSECSTVEAPPYYGGNEAELRACAEAVDAEVKDPVVTIDGRKIRLQEVETRLLSIALPDDDILGSKENHTMSVGHGWVAQFNPSLGTHTIELHSTGTYLDKPLDNFNTTTINVRPSWW
jgi:hypothetical protein